MRFDRQRRSRERERRTREIVSDVSLHSYSSRERFRTLLSAPPSSREPSQPPSRVKSILLGASAIPDRPCACRLRARRNLKNLALGPPTPKTRFEMRKPKDLGFCRNPIISRSLTKTRRLNEIYRVRTCTACFQILSLSLSFPPAVSLFRPPPLPFYVDTCSGLDCPPRFTQPVFAIVFVRTLFYFFSTCTSFYSPAAAKVRFLISLSVLLLPLSCYARPDPRNLGIHEGSSVLHRNPRFAPRRRLTRRCWTVGETTSVRKSQVV